MLIRLCLMMHGEVLWFFNACLLSNNATRQAGQMMMLNKFNACKMQDVARKPAAQQCYDVSRDVFGLNARY